MGLRGLLSRVAGNPIQMMRTWPGTPYPLGATWDGEGVNFALFSQHATRVELCIFSAPDAGEATETIAAFVLACLVPGWFPIIAWAFAAMTLYTALARIVLATQAFR